ncbi:MULTISPECIES: hypothetical protein [Streptomyces]|uniref:hypothetical protein n=1 Tax=Streptomyces TaxID=1883 RepID=UPI00099DC969|nr:MULTISPECIES: hypothetical protein [Streptomyces]
MGAIDRADDTLRHLARYRETVRQNDDPKCSPPPAPASIRRRTGTAPPAPAPTRTSPSSSAAAWQALEEAGAIVDPRAAQIDRLKADVGELKERVAERDLKISELLEPKQRALSRIAAPHREIERLRAQIGAGNEVTPLPRQPAPGAVDSCI